MAERLFFGLVALGVIWFCARYFEWKNLYYPAKALESTPASMGLAYENITFVTEDGRTLNGWWIPCENARGTVIHCHGNAGNIGDRVWMAADFNRLGVNVFLFDYRGYGLSRGIPTERGTYLDARAAYEVVRAKYGDAENPPVIVHGQSLGGAVAVQLALDKPVRGLMVESTFSSVPEMARILYPGLPVWRLCSFKYDSLSKVGRLGIPKLFAHSREDDLVPFELGRKLYEAAAQPKQFIQLTGGHNEAGWPASPAYWSAIERFVASVFNPLQ